MTNQILILYFIFGFVSYCESIKLTALFDSNDVKGTVTFQQFTNATTQGKTSIIVSLDETLYTYENVTVKIHQYPSIYKQDCNTVGNVVTNLSTTHGFFKHNSSFIDTEVQTTGTNSMVVRTLVLYDTDMNIISCTTILPDSSSTIHYASTVISNNKFAGKFEFLNTIGGSTMIFGTVGHADGSTASTTGHNWIISSGNCATIYNPLKQNGTCSVKQESTCKIGDLKSKFGTLTVGESSYFIGSDINLPLSGDNSVINQNVVISASGSQNVLYCGKIKNVPGYFVQSKFITNQSEEISGNFNFTQLTPYHPTEVSIKLDGLGKRVKNYHVHQFPISDNTNPCSAASVGGHLNPYNVDAKKSPAPGKGTSDKYEVGDLSMRYGFLTNLTTYRKKTMDPSLPLFGMKTSTGRSIVIHKLDGKRFTCADIVPVNSIVLSATINYTATSSSVLSGTVKVKQFVQSDGAVTQTVMVLNLNYKSNSSKQTLDNNWHTHKLPVGVDVGGICQSVGGHYNPNAVSTTPSDIYKAQCTSNRAYRCEIGDSSMKVGTYNIGTGQSFYADHYSPLFGSQSSFGRSITFHKANRAAARLACADVVPDEGNGVAKFQVDLVSSPVVKNVTNLQKKLHDIFNLSSADEQWKLSYMKISNSSIVSDIECFQVSFYVIDDSSPQNAKAYRSKLESFKANPGSIENEQVKICKPQTPTAKPATTKPTSSSTVFKPSFIFLTSLVMIGMLHG